MSSKAAEQLVETVRKARDLSNAMPEVRMGSHETDHKYERAIRFYIQSNQVDKVSLSRIVMTLCIS